MTNFSLHLCLYLPLLTLCLVRNLNSALIIERSLPGWLVCGATQQQQQQQNLYVTIVIINVGVIFSSSSPMTIKLKKKCSMLCVCVWSESNVACKWCEWNSMCRRAHCASSYDNYRTGQMDTKIKMKEDDKNIYLKKWNSLRQSNTEISIWWGDNGSQPINLQLNFVLMKSK